MPPCINCLSHNAARRNTTRATIYFGSTFFFSTAVSKLLPLVFEYDALDDSGVFFAASVTTAKLLLLRRGRTGVKAMVAARHKHKARTAAGVVIFVYMFGRLPGVCDCQMTNRVTNSLTMALL